MASKKNDDSGVQAMTTAHWVRLIITYLLVPLVLLVCGGDLGWWQAWAFSLLIVSSGIGARMWAERRHPGLLAERAKFDRAPDVKPWDRVLAPLMAVSLSFPLIIVAGLDHCYGWSPEFPVMLNVLGFVPCWVWIANTYHPLTNKNPKRVYSGVLSISLTPSKSASSLTNFLSPTNMAVKARIASLGLSLCLSTRSWALRITRSSAPT